MRKATIFILALTMLLSCICMPVFAAELTTTSTPTPVEAPEVDKRATDTLVGAIRFDGWSGRPMASEWGVAEKLKEVLTSEYSDRIPFFAKIKSGTVDFTRYMQAYLDTEIAFAAAAGIDYFAYTYFPDGSGLEIPLKYHVASTKKEEVKMAVILKDGYFDAKKDITDLFSRLVKNTAYLTTLNDRAVIYVEYSAENPDYVLNCINAVRKKANSNKLNTPFIIVMDAPSEADAIAVGADAMSWYNVTATNGQAFADLAAAAEAKWEAAKSNTSLSVVPLVTTGYDKRPIAAKPISISVDDVVKFADTATADQYAAKATPAEIGTHLQKAIAFNAANTDKTVFNSVLMYAWNEFADGAWLCPTQDANGAYVSDRLEAVKTVLNPTGAFPTMVPTPTPLPTAEPSPTPEGFVWPFDPLYLIPAGAVLVVAILVIVVAASNKKKKAAK